VFGFPVDTWKVNVAVIWLMTFLFYVALYFRLLRKLLTSGEKILGRKTIRGSDRELI